MVRKMTKAPSHAWRAVIVLRPPLGEEYTEYRGPYWRKSAAKGQLSTARREHRPEWTAQIVNGWVESAPLGDWTKEAQ